MPPHFKHLAIEATLQNY